MKPSVLFQEIEQQGYTGSYDTVARYARRIRQSLGLKLRQRYSKQILPKVVALLETLSDTS